MKANFTISEADYIKSNRLSYRLTAKKGLFYLCLIIILALSYFLSAPRFIQAVLIGGLIGILIIEIFARSFIYSMHLKKQYREYAAIKKMHSIELVDDGVLFTAPDASMLLRWQSIIGWRQDRDYILVYQTRKIYHLIPKSISEQGFDVDLLVARLTEKAAKEF